MSDTATGHDLIMTFPSVAGKRFAEAALYQAREETQRRRRAEDLLRLDRGSHLGHLVEIDRDTYVAEITERTPATWAVITQDRADHRRFYTLDEALILAVELRNGGGPNDQGHIYAARMLRAGKPTEEATR